MSNNSKQREQTILDQDLLVDRNEFRKTQVNFIFKINFLFSS